LIDALDLKADEPLRLAKKTVKNLNCALRRLRHMYAHTDTDDPCSIPFRNA
jgi:hypothetical protein